MDAEYSEGPNLSKQTTEIIQSIMSGLEQIAEQITEPIDPKVLPLLEVIHDILEEQLVGDKVYEWMEDDEVEVDDDDGPSVEDLNSWLDGD